MFTVIRALFAILFQYLYSCCYYTVSKLFSARGFSLSKLDASKYAFQMLNYLELSNQNYDCKKQKVEYYLSKMFLKYGSRKKNSFCCRCSTFLSPNFVEIKNSFIRTLLTFNSKNFGIIYYQKNTDENEPI